MLMIDIQRPKKKLTTQIIWIAAFGVALTLLTLVVAERWLAYLQVVIDERNKLAFQARVVKERVGGLIRGVNVVVEQIGRDTGDSGCDQASLNRDASQYTEVPAFTVIEANGTLRCASVPALAGADRAATDFFLDAKASRDSSRLFVGKPQKGPLGHDVMNFSRAVIGDSGQLKRVVLASIDLRYFDDLLGFLLTEPQVGIPAHRLKELFQPFSRLGKEGGNIPGAGLGLELTRRLVELMGGQTGADSELGQGSLFWIELNETTAAEHP